MSMCRLTITVALLASYIVGYAALGNIPQVLCKGTDGHSCIERVGNRCCDADHAAEAARGKVEHDGSAPQVTTDSSCGQCSDSEIPAGHQHQLPSHHGKEKSCAVAWVPAFVATAPVAMIANPGTQSVLAPPPPTGGFIVLRC